MDDQCIGFSREREMPIYYGGQQFSTRRVNFLIEGVVSVKLKAIMQLDDIRLAQANNYFEAYNLDVGLLIHFGARSLEFRESNQQELQAKKSR